jgi:hypothetical protein
LGRVADPDPHYFGKLDPDPHIRKAKSGSALKSKFSGFKGLKFSRGGPWTLTMEAWRIKMKPCRICRPVVADSNHFDEEELK